MVLAAAPVRAQGGFALGERGLAWQSPGGQVQLDLGGRVQLDDISYYGLPSAEHVLKFRQVRLNLTGELGDHLRFMIEHEFADPTGWRNLWVDYAPAHDIAVRAGNFLVPFSMEGLQSFRSGTFMERSVANALAPAMGLGADVSWRRDRWTATAGWFSDPIRDDDGLVRHRGDGVVARATWLPLSGRKDLVHLGAAFERRWLGPGGTLQIQTGPEIAFTPTLISAPGLARAKSMTSVGLEAAWTHRSFIVQGQAIQTVVTRTGASAERLRGGYVHAAWVLTGQGYDYNRTAGIVGAPILGGRQALEAAVRYSVLNLNSRDARGGVARDLTLAVNWYPNRNIRVMANYVRSRTYDAPPVPVRRANVFALRLQTAF